MLDSIVGLLITMVAIPWLFWMVVLIVFIGVLSLNVNEHNTSAGFLVVAFVWVLHVTNVVPWTWDNWSVIGLTLTAYFFIGLVWGAFKWRSLSVSYRDNWIAIKRKFFKAHKILDDETLDSSQIRALIKYANEQNYKPFVDKKYLKEIIIPRDVPPKVTYHKNLVVGWVLYWIPSMTWAVLHDAVIAIGEFIVSISGRAFNAIAVNAFGDEAEANVKSEVLED